MPSGKEVGFLNEFADEGATGASIAISPDSTLLASTSNNDTIRLHELSSGKLVYTLKGHTSKIESLAFSPMARSLPVVQRINQSNYGRCPAAEKLGS